MKYETKVRCLSFLSDERQFKVFGTRLRDSQTGKVGPSMRVVQQAIDEGLVEPGFFLVTDKGRKFLSRGKTRRLVFSVPVANAEDVRTLVQSYLRMVKDAELV